MQQREGLRNKAIKKVHWVFAFCRNLNFVHLIFRKNFQEDLPLANFYLRKFNASHGQAWKGRHFPPRQNAYPVGGNRLSLCPAIGLKCPLHEPQREENSCSNMQATMPSLDKISKA